MVTHAEVLAEELKGKDCDIFLGEHTGTINYADHDIEQMAVMRGTILGAVANMLVIETVVSIAKDTITKKLYINEWNIKAVMEHDSRVPLLKILSNDEQRRLKR